MFCVVNRLGLDYGNSVFTLECGQPHYQSKQEECNTKESKMRGWRIILVDGNNQLRNGGITMYRSPDDAEEEAWRRAEQHDALVSNSRDRIINVVCSKIR